MDTYAYCGTHQVPSSQEQTKMITFFPWQSALSYCDEVMMATIAISLPSEYEKLHWLRRRDEQVRSEMAALINDGTPGVEALKIAWAKYAHMWIMKDTLAVASQADSSSSEVPRGQVRQRDEGKGAKGKSRGEKKARLSPTKVRTASTDKNGTKLCGAFNGKRGCVARGRDCPQRGRHLCSVILPNGEICKDKTHTAMTHFQAR